MFLKSSESLICPHNKTGIKNKTTMRVFGNFIIAGLKNGFKKSIIIKKNNHKIIINFRNQNDKCNNLKKEVKQRICPILVVSDQELASPGTG